jgi:hypothetical protein
VEGELDRDASRGWRRRVVCNVELVVVVVMTVCHVVIARAFARSGRACSSESSARVFCASDERFAASVVRRLREAEAARR